MAFNYPIGSGGKPAAKAAPKAPAMVPQAAQMPEGGGEEQDGAAIAQEHGPAHEVNIQHEHEMGSHHVHSVHSDGHEHHSDHGSAQEAHQHAAKLGGAHEGEEYDHEGEEY